MYTLYECVCVFLCRNQRTHILVNKAKSILYSTSVMLFTFIYIYSYIYEYSFIYNNVCVEQHGNTNSNSTNHIINIISIELGYERFGYAVKKMCGVCVCGAHSRVIKHFIKLQGIYLKI